MAHWRLADIWANDKTPSYFIHHLATSRCRSIGCSVFRLPNVRRVSKRVAPPTVWRFRLLQSFPKSSLKMAHWRLADILVNGKTSSYFIHHLATSRCRSTGCSVFRLPQCA
ncbi:MAG: hypothetical protein Q4A85_09790 [Kingella sp. (in: b-proteobacteria)]|nr:hypothetical protein [Kingella sp. (in: b-proteobacteria)]